jgi:hypothetical protein
MNRPAAPGVERSIPNTARTDPPVSGRYMSVNTARSDGSDASSSSAGVTASETVTPVGSRSAASSSRAVRRARVM